MLVYVLRRILISIPVVLIASFVLFVFVRETFDPTARLRHDPRPPGHRRTRSSASASTTPCTSSTASGWASSSRATGASSARTREPVTEMTQRALWNTVQLIFWGILVSATIAIAIGVYSAVKQYSIPDYLFTGLSYLAIAMPPFWFGLIAINVFVFKSQDWFSLDEAPVYFVGLHSPRQSGYDMDYLRHLVLPVMTLSVQIVGSWSRFQRAAMLDVMSADYIRTARAKGVPRRKVIFKHGVRNALIPLVTVMAVDIGLLFGGLIITETIFSVPGMGRMFIVALLQGDVAVLEAWMIVVAVFVIAFNLLADVLYGILDPRIRVA